MAEAGCELNQAVVHSYVSASCGVLPSAADLADLAD